MSSFASKKCLPCHGGIPTLSEEEQIRFLREVPGWQIVQQHHLSRSYNFPDFKTALAFLNKVAEISEAEGHHPDLLLRWGQVRVDIWTHAVNGLTENDFILAAKCDQ